MEVPILFAPADRQAFCTIDEQLFSLIPWVNVDTGGAAPEHPGNRIVCGNGEIIFTDERIYSGNCHINSTVSQDELTIDTLTAKLELTGSVPILFSPQDYNVFETADDKIFTITPWVTIQTVDPSSFTYGQEVRYYHDDILIGLFYMESIERTGRTSYKINCVSAIGLLEKSTHYGGVYFGADMADILSEIIGGIVPYTLSEELQNIKVHGWLPIATRRANLHQLLFAEGVSVAKDSDGRLMFAILQSKTPVYIPDDRMFLGGSIDFRAPANRISVTEHTYKKLDVDERKTLFEETEVYGSPVAAPSGTVYPNAVLVTFNEPVHDLEVSGSTILESGFNYAVLTPADNCLLTGKVYSHTTRVVTVDKPDGSGFDKDHEVSVTDVTLISSLNSDNVAKRLMSYYGYAQVVTNDLIVGTERPGDPVSFRDPFDREAFGFLQSLDINMSRLLRAAGAMITGYTAKYFGNSYGRYAIITHDLVWTVPDNTESIRVILIGGGTGGDGGQDGSRASEPPPYTERNNRGGYEPGIGGSGGSGGSPGVGGKIYQATIEVTPGQSFNVHIGAGGSGGAGGGYRGSDGGATTFGAYSSDDGVRSELGYTNIMIGETYALPGTVRGINGGRGGGYESGYYAGGNVTDYNGTVWKAGKKVSASDEEFITITFEGGGFASGTHGFTAGPGSGGGAAVGHNGGDGGAPTVNESGGGTATGGRGGDGANAIAAAAQTKYGWGGSGGHGGGGAGGTGLSISTRWNQGSSGYIAGYGTPGNGGQGGAGGQGAAIIFY